MRYACYILVLLILLASSARSQQVVEADTGMEGYMALNGYMEVLQTTTAISIDSVLTPAAQQAFRRLGGAKVLFLGYTPNQYWYRVTLINSGQQPGEYVFLLGGLGIRDARVWSHEGGRWSLLGKTGYQYPFSQRPYPYPHHGFPLLLPPTSSKTLYISKDESHAYKTVAFLLVSAPKMKVLEHRFYFLFGITSGLMLLFFILNLYLYFSIREQLHLWYALYLVTILFYLIKSQGIDAEFLGLDSTLGYRLTYMGSIGSLAVGFLLTVVQHFLANLRSITKMYKVLLFLKWSSFASATVQSLIFYIEPSNSIEWIVFEWSNKTTLFSFLFVLAACCASFYKGFKPALFLLVGQALFIIGGISKVLFLGAESYLFPPSLFEIGLIAEVVIISFGLMYRYRQYKEEQEALKQKLEAQQVHTATQILVMQEAEQRRIAADLHDELGGNLAALKMTLQSFELHAEQAQTLIGLLDKTSANARTIAHNLMPPGFEQVSLCQLLSSHYSRLTREGGIRFHFYCSGNSNPFTKQDDLMIYRIIMELTSNIIRHSRSTEATIQLVYHVDGLTLTTEDNGQGFNVQHADGMGLKNIHSRVSFLGGTLAVDSGDRGSTTIISIPYKK